MLKFHLPCHESDHVLGLAATSPVCCAKRRIAAIPQRALALPDNCDGTFRDMMRAVRLDRAMLVMGDNFGDLDNDGWLDVYLGTVDVDCRALLPIRMFRSDAGRVFRDVTTPGGLGHLQKGHRISFADLDNDGDHDVHAELGGANECDVAANALFANPGHGRGWLSLQLEGRESWRSAVGARVRLALDTPAGPWKIFRAAGLSSSFGGNPLRLEIGAGDATRITGLEIRWPSGVVQRHSDVALDTRYRVSGGGQPVRVTLPRVPAFDGRPQRRSLA